MAVVAARDVRQNVWMHCSAPRRLLSVIAGLTLGASALVALPAGATNALGLYPHELSVATSLGGAGLLGLDCTSPTSCVAVGYDNSGLPVVAEGDPTTWTSSSVEELSLGSAFGGSGTLSAVSCVSSSQCTAVGDDISPDPIVLTGNPATWTASDVTSMTLGSTFGDGGGLLGVSCPSATDCVAVGANGGSQPLIVTGNPATWTTSNAAFVDLQSAFGDGGALYAVSCVSTTQCTAVGNDRNNQPLVLTGDPATWTPQEVTVSGTNGGGGFLYGVSCVSATQCTAVGNSATGAPLVLTGNPTSWAVETAVLPATEGSGGDLNAVSCTTSTSCTAVGNDGDNQPLVFTGDPTTWTSGAVEITLSKAYGGNGSLEIEGVSCPSSCVAAGYDRSGQPLVLDGDDSYLVTYNAANGGSYAVPPTLVASGTTITLGAAPVWSAATFAGWSDGTSVYQPGATYTVGDANVTLTAQWKGATLNHVVYFSRDSASLSTDAKAQLATFAQTVQNAGVASLTVKGYTDHSATEKARRSLALQRATAVATYLRTRFAAERDVSVTLHVSGAGTGSSSNAALDRRVVIAS